ncbi:MAG: dephospho-CoA kinase [Deltaproteobacteria bacterium]|jgi:23S rRNA pseudouridine1911/1915/1917 synthase|nr:dephospho-CoA kinase [Deltaproteobacteria bacterium]
MLHSCTLLVPDAARGERLDRFLGNKIPSVSRERVKNAIREGNCLLDGRVCAVASTRLAPGQRIELRLALKLPALVPEEGELSLIWHDEHLAVLDKAAGLTVHPCPSCPGATLVHRLLARFPQLARMEGLRPGIVHRLDKDTSGLMVVALHEEARLKLAEDFARREVEKDYLALAQGVPDPRKGDIRIPIGRHPLQKIKMAPVPEGKGGRPAHSRYAVLYADPAERFALLEARIFTGRTHQIRVHMASLGHPLWGDSLYGAVAGSEHVPRQMLHAHKLAFTHPMTGSRLRFTSPPPPDFLHSATLLSRRMRPLVIVGAPGSGKSLLLGLLERAGLPCFSADAAVHRLYESGRDGWLCLHRRYGGHFTPDGMASVDRKALFAAMREDRRILHDVQDMIHPLVHHELHQFWRLAATTGEECAAAEIPLYLENGRRDEENGLAAPLLIGVYCTDQERRARLAAGRGWNEDTQALLDSWQWPQERKMQACDVVIDNSGPPEQMERQAEDLLTHVRALRRKEEEELAARLTALWA